MKATFKKLATKKAEPIQAWSSPPRNRFNVLDLDIEETDSTSTAPSHQDGRVSDTSYNAAATPAKTFNTQPSSDAPVSEGETNCNTHDWQLVSRSRQRGSDEPPIERTNRPTDVTSVDWNAEKQRRRRTVHSPLTQISLNSGRYSERRRPEHRTGARTRDGIPLSDIRPGVMLFRFDIRPSITNTKPDDRKLVFDFEGVQWLRKGRYWLVLSFHGDHIIELPIYTFNDQGLKQKSAWAKEFYNSVKPPWAVDFVNQSPNQQMLEIESLERIDESLRTTMCVNVSEPIARTVDADWGSRLVGRLSNMATEELLRRAKAFVGTTDDASEGDSSLKS